MSLASAKTGKVSIGTNELRIGPLSLAGRLTAAHSVGLIDSTSLNVEQQVADLQAGFPQEVIASEVTSRSTSITATLREYSRRNLGLMLGQGLLYPGDLDSAKDLRMKLLRDALPGDTVYGDKLYVANSEGLTADEARALWEGWIMAHSDLEPANAMVSRVAAVRVISRVPAALGPELLTAASWTAGLGWTKVVATGAYQHTGGTGTLDSDATLVTATKYRLEYVVTNRKAGSVAITFGGVTSGAVTKSGGKDLTSSAVTALKVTPTDDFDGTIKVSLRIITTPAATTVTTSESVDPVWAAQNESWNTDVDTFAADDAIWTLDANGDVATSAAAAINKFIELRLDSGTRAQIPFYKGDVISKLAPIGLANGSKVRYFTAQLVSMDLATGRPLIRNFWKCSIAAGLSQSNSPTDFASSELNLRVMTPIVNDFASPGSPLYHLRSILPTYRQFLFGELSDEAIA